MRSRLSSWLLAAAVVLAATVLQPAAAGIASIAETTAADDVQYATMAQQSAVASASSGAQASKEPSGQSGTTAANNTPSVHFSSSVILFDVGDISATVRQNGRVANWWVQMQQVQLRAQEQQSRHRVAY
jgi:hypothetical protein